MSLTPPRASRLAAAALAVATLSASLSGCAPLIVGTAVGGAIMAADRRTSGMQVEDKAIELKASRRIGEALGDRGHINTNAYNRLLLLTGEVPTEADRVTAEQVAARVENVTSVVNQLIVGPNSSIGTRSNDVLLASKVRATLVDARDLISSAFEIVVERGEVHLMGIVTEREARRATELAASIEGVRKVVRVFEVVSEDELARRAPKPTGAGPTEGAQGSPSASPPAGVTVQPVR